MKNIEYLRIPYVDKPVSRLFFGTMEKRMAQGEDASELLDPVYEMGINAFDTANVYGLSECSLGEWFNKRGIREKIVVLTKGAHPDRWHDRVTPYDILSDIHTSLARMNTDYIDIYLLHRDDESKPVGPIIETLNSLAAGGKIKCFGGSNWTHNRIDEINEYAYAHNLQPFSVTSPYFGLAVQVENPFIGKCVGISGEQGKEAREYYTAKNMPVISYSSIGAGFFSGKIKSSDPEGAVKILSESTVKGYCSADNFKRLRRAEILAEEKGKTVTQIALAWVIKQKMPVFPIVGTSRPSAMAENIEAAGIELSEKEIEWLALESDGRE